MSRSDELFDPTRRDFCRHACQAASLLGAGVVLPACGGSPSSPSGSPGPPAPSLPGVTGSLAGNTMTVTVDPSSPLASTGGAALVQGGGRAVLVARTGDNAFVALTAICTHEACTINGFQDPLYVCPCHGSQFSTSGGVVRGPATRALPQFATRFSDGVLTITV